jgi:lipoprotein signal peptidase
VDKYLLIMLIVLIMGMAFSVFKDLQNPDLVLFYAQLAGAIIIIGYSTFKNRNNRKSAKKR